MRRIVIALALSAALQVGSMAPAATPSFPAAFAQDPCPPNVCPPPPEVDLKLLEKCEKAAEKDNEKKLTKLECPDG